MTHLNNENICYEILSLVVPHINYSSDIYSLIQVSKLFKQIVPSHITKIKRGSWGTVELGKILGFKNLVETKNLTLKISDSNLDLPMNFIRGSLNIDKICLLEKLLARDFPEKSYISIDYLNYCVIMRNNKWYADSSLMLNSKLSSGSELRIEPIEDLTLEYLTLITNSQLETQNRIISLNMHICILHENVLKMLNLSLGPHQYRNIDLSLYAYWTENLKGSPSCHQRNTLMNNFMFLRDDQKPVIKNKLLSDAIIPDIKKFVDSEQILFNKLSKNLNMEDYLNYMS